MKYSKNYEFEQFNNPVQLLESELKNRISNNSRYSLRSFAKYLEIPPGRLSEIFSGKRKLTIAVGEKISHKLSLSPLQTANFLKAIAEKNIKMIHVSKGYKKRTILKEDIFNVIADWHHFAILSLIETKNFRSDHKWMAMRLGISVVEVNFAIQRLLKLKMITNKNGKYKLSKESFSTSEDVESRALQKSHKQSLEQSIASLEEVPVKLRDISSITMAIDLSKLKKAKKEIREFRKRIANIMESGNQTEVYNLNIQLIPITKAIE
ncbi:MAG TPA: DUF4423 domain-containing protein [Patescibacteria group bacterium]|nr:MAG: hypothetical protein A2417_14500 [Bdellovibrionales bacterium RIFOXYC1_FULL_37_79]OFZ57582.1 MAG: hypothetical protein A2381_18825 [Bdellovibrionales bacterium RIFOXYB1_FULL_37_110]HLD91021.1 DUF4423 domain-containing protein [Patescibacteria group bacterium]